MLEKEPYLKRQRQEPEECRFFRQYLFMCITSAFNNLKYMIPALHPDELGVDATEAVHVGDDPTNDKQGALAAGLESWYAQLFHNLRPIFCWKSLNRI